MRNKRTLCPCDTKFVPSCVIPGNTNDSIWYLGHSVLPFFCLVNRDLIESIPLLRLDHNKVAIYKLFLTNKLYPILDNSYGHKLHSRYSILASRLVRHFAEVIYFVSPGYTCVFSRAGNATGQISLRCWRKRGNRTCITSRAETQLYLHVWQSLPKVKIV